MKTLQGIDAFKKYLPPLLLVLSVFVFFGEIILSGKPLFGTDFVIQFYPWKQFLHNQVRLHGELPLWNPHVLSGTPYLADIQMSMFYPLGFLFYLLPSSEAYGYTVILHWILGVLFMYGFTRTIHMGKAGAFLASIIFAYNGYVVGHLYAGHLTFIQNYFWLPLIFLCIHRFSHTHKIRYTLWAGLILGVQILGGFPQIAFYTILSSLLFLLYSVYTRSDATTKPRLRVVLAGIFSFVVLGFSLAAVQILPTYEFTTLSTRSGGVSYAFATTDSFPPTHFLTLLMPNLFGNPANATYWKSQEIWKFWELCGYTGIAPLLLLGFLKGMKQLAHVKRFFLFLLVLSLFLALGKYNPLYRFIYYLPGFHHFRIPAQILYLFIFAVAILAGLATDRLSRKKGSLSFFIVLAGTMLVLLVIPTMTYLTEPGLFFQYVASIFTPGNENVDMPDLWARVQHTVPSSLFTAIGLVTLFSLLLIFKNKKWIGSSSFAVLLLFGTMADLWSFALPLVKTTTLEKTVKNEQLRPNPDGGQDMFRVVTLSREIGPSESILHGYQDIHGYNPMILKRYLEYINRSQDLDWPPDAVNVRYITRLDNNMVRLLNLRYAILDGGRIYTIENVLPRAFIVHQAISLPQEEVLDYLASSQFRPREVVVLETPADEHDIPHAQNLSPSMDMHDPKSPYSEKRCQITGYKHDEVSLDVSIEKAGYLVLSEVNYPGWNAYVNGQKLNVMTGNYIFRVVPLPPGDHQVTFKMECRSFKTGVLVSAIAILCFVFVQGFSIIKNNDDTGK
jgi:hypothetical protein